MAALALLALAAPLGVMAQASGCLQLTGSTMCPAFSDQYINPANLSGSWPFMSNVNSVASFDSELADYLVNPYEFRATKYQRQLGCQNQSTTFVLEYARTFLCSEFTQISYSAGCYPSGAVRRMACQSTCLMFAASENNLVNNQVACDPIANYAPRAGNLTKDFAACTDWTSLATNDTTTCVLGQVNEPNCGYGTSTAQLCQRCNPAQGEVDSCCGVASSNVTAFCGFTLAAAQILPTSATNPTSVSQTALLPTSTGAYTGGAGTAPAATSTAGSGGSGSGVGESNIGGSTTSGSSGLGGGAIAGIVIGALAGALIIGGLIAFFLLRRRKANAGPRSPSTLGDAEKVAFGGAAAGAGAGAAGGAAMKEKSLEKPYGTAALAKPYNAPSSTNASSRNLPSPSIADSASANKSLGAAAGVGAAAAAGGAAAAAAGASRPVSGAPTTGSSGGSSSNDGRNLVSSYRDQYSSTDITPGSDVVAIYSYQPNLPDELTLEPEMIVTVRKIFDDGWASGRITRGAVAGRTVEGAFPLVVCTALGADMNDNASTSSSLSSRRLMTAESSGTGLPMSSARSGRTSSIGHASSFDTAHETAFESGDEDVTARQGGGGFLSGLVNRR